MDMFSRNSRRVIFLGHPVVDQQIHFLETEQRLCRKLVELMEGFLRMENKTKISPTHQMAAQKNISKTRSSWVNCALRDEEAVYWVSVAHYEAVSVGN